MGCFSFKCLECGRGVRSSSFSGECVHLFLLEEGKVIQKMSGEYDSYGRVFIDGTQNPDVKHALRESQEWKNPKTGVVDDAAWGEVCNLMHDEENIKNGIAAIHIDCFKSVPKIRSCRDPNQGWGDDEDNEGELFGSLAPEGSEYKPLKPIPNYDAKKEHEVNSIRERLWRLKSEIPLLDAQEYLKRFKVEMPSYREEFAKTSLASLKKEQKKLLGRLKKLGFESEGE